MIEHCIDCYGTRLWYDFKSNIEDISVGITRDVNIDGKYFLTRDVNIDGKYFYVRPHKEDGPAIIWKNGTEFYYIEGQCHRDDGPAVIFPYGDIQWWINGRKYLFEDWCEELKKPEEEINFIKLKWNIV